eukprot:5799961-Amphidinium_carterae.1
MQGHASPKGEVLHSNIGSATHAGVPCCQTRATAQQYTVRWHHGSAATAGEGHHKTEHVVRHGDARAATYSRPVGHGSANTTGRSAVQDYSSAMKACNVMIFVRTVFYVGAVCLRKQRSTARDDVKRPYTSSIEWTMDSQKQHKS